MRRRGRSESSMSAFSQIRNQSVMRAATGGSDSWSLLRSCRLFLATGMRCGRGGADALVFLYFFSGG